MLLPLWYAILFGASMIIYPILILICIHLYPPPKYSILTRTISGLGNPEHRSAKIFNPMIISMGFIISPFPYYLFQVLPAIWLTYVGIGFFFCVPIGLVLVGLFPEHKERGHMIAAYVTFIGAIIANLCLIYPILRSALSIFIIIIQIVALVACIPLFSSAMKQLSSYTPDQPIDNIFYNINIWEWTQYLMLQIWILAIYLNLLVLP